VKKIKPPFKANSEDKLFCPKLRKQVEVDAYCHGWALQDRLCPDSQDCEPYLAYAEKELTSRQRKIYVTSEAYTKLQERAKVAGLSPNELAEKIILRAAKEVKNR